MARCPFTRWNPGGTPGGPITPRVVVLHTEATVGRARPHSGLEWHFMVFNDGSIDQVVDTGLQADANYKANSFAISIETEDDGSPDADPWTPQQVASIIALCRWANQVHGIPLRAADAWNGSGIGHHTMWGAPSPWTPVSKSCPGAARKAQFWNEIIPALTTPPLEEEVSAPAVATFNGKTYVFGRGADKSLWYTVLQPGSPAGGWMPLDGDLESGPTAAVDPVANRLDVMAVGTDGAIWSRFMASDGKWSGWYKVGGRVV